MKKLKRIYPVFSCLLLIIAMIPIQAFAAGKIDLNQTGSLTISFQDKGEPIEGAQFDLYQVADVDAYGSLTPVESFQQFDVDIRGENAEVWQSLVSTMENYVLRDQPAPTESGTTDAGGTLCFPADGKNLIPGIYLVLGQRCTQNGYYFDPAPSLVLIPTEDPESDEWVYDVTVNIKSESAEIPEEPTTVDRKVLKIWKDTGYEQERPDEVVIQLLQDETVYDTVTLSAENNWRHTWSDLDASSQWKVVEEEQDNYTVSIAQQGITFVVTNTYSSGTSNPPGNGGASGGTTNPTNSNRSSGNQNSKLPQTGQLWWPVQALSAAGLLLLVMGLIRRRGDFGEK